MWPARQPALSNNRSIISMGSTTRPPPRRPGRRSRSPLRRMGDDGRHRGTLLVSTVSLVAAAVILGLQAVVFAIGALGGPAQASLRPDLREVRRPAARPGHREGTGAAAEVRTAGRLRVRGRRRRRIRHGPGRPRTDRHRLRADRRLPQRRLRHLPRLSALPARRAAASSRPSPA